MDQFRMFSASGFSRLEVGSTAPDLSAHYPSFFPPGPGPSVVEKVWAAAPELAAYKGTAFVHNVADLRAVIHGAVLTFESGAEHLAQWKKGLLDFERSYSMNVEERLLYALDGSGKERAMCFYLSHVGDLGREKDGILERLPDPGVALSTEIRGAHRRERPLHAYGFFTEGGAVRIFLSEQETFALRDPEARRVEEDVRAWNDKNLERVVRVLASR